MNTIDYTAMSEKLIIEQFKRQYGPDDVSGIGSQSGQSAVAVVTFPRYSSLSNVIPFSITNASRLNIQWGPDQENKGQLFYGQDFFVTGNQIQLTDGSGPTTDWTPTIQANALGLLNVIVTQG
jgi:hypothetical protein